ncbi:MAG: LacI family transcriptional regulator [Balneolales bacterium]|nr:LacI family transcriptional regulator [Balneolales bacterium]
MPRVTIKDLARSLGVAPSTISRALADHPAISQDMKAKVKALAAEMNYTPNLRARFLQSRHANIIALIIPEVHSFFIPEMIYGVNTAAAEHDFSVIILQSDNSLENEIKMLQYAANLPVEGILLSVSEETDNEEHIEKVEALGIACVMVDRFVEDSRFSYVSMNDVEAAFVATKHLIDRGHKHVLGLMGNPNLTMTRLRKKGFKAALGEANLQQHHILEVKHILELERAVSDYLKIYPEITAVFSMSDELLVSLYHALLKSGYKIPDDISLISISDGFAPYYLYPNITYLNHSGFEVGIKAVDMLMKRIRMDENRRSTETFNVPTRVFELDSIADLRKEKIKYEQR